MNDPAVAVKLTAVAPELAVTDEGTETFALLELSAMDAPEPGAALLRVTTQADVPPGLNVAGLQLKAETLSERRQSQGSRRRAAVQRSGDLSRTVAGERSRGRRETCGGGASDGGDRRRHRNARTVGAQRDRRAGAWSRLAESDHTGGCSIGTQRGRIAAQAAHNPPSVEPIVMLPPLTETGMLVPAESERTTCVTWIAVDVLVVPGARVKVN